jgi:threonine-phosphate decarboxylase
MSRRVVLQQHGGNIYEIVQDYDIQKDEIKDFSSNTNPLGPPALLNEVLKRNLNFYKYFPDPNSTQLKKALSEVYDVPSKNIIIGNGSCELISAISKFLSPCYALVLAPTFSEYERSMLSFESTVENINILMEEHIELDLERLKKKLRSTGVIFLCNPNNPTGTILDKTQILRLIELSKKNITFVVIDESFMEFTENGETLIKEALGFPNVFIIKSLTKLYSIPGVRLGFGIGPSELIKKLHDLLPYWNVNTLAQIIGQCIVKDSEFIRKTQKFVKEERKFLIESLKKTKIFLPYPSLVNFILVRINTHKLSSTQLAEKLILEDGILIRDCSSFFGLNEKFIRISVRKRNDNILLIKALKRIERELDG